MDLLSSRRRPAAPKAHEQAAPALSRLLILTGARLGRAAAGLLSFLRLCTPRPCREQAGETPAAAARTRVRGAAGSARTGPGRGFFQIQPASGRNGSPRTVCFSSGGAGAAAGRESPGSPAGKGAGREQAMRAAESMTARRMRRFPETLFDVATGAKSGGGPGKGGAGACYIRCPAACGAPDDSETDGAGFI